MHTTDEELKALIDCVAMRVDDETDTLGDDLDVKRVLDERDDVRILWSLTDLLEKLRQESRSRMRVTVGAEADRLTVASAGLSNAPIEIGAAGQLLLRLEKLEALVKEHEGDRMAMRAELGAAQATIGDLLAQANDHREQLNDVRPVLTRLGGVVQRNESALDVLRATMKARSKIRSRIENGRYKEFKDFQETVERWSRELKDAVLDLLEALKGQVEALQLQADDRWVETQKMDRSLSLKIDELGRELRLHVGDGEVQH